MAAARGYPITGGQETGPAGAAGRDAGGQRILAVSDIVSPTLYNLRIAEQIGPIDLLLSCGDLPPYYLDFLTTLLSARCYHVIGNHCAAPHLRSGSGLCAPDAYPGAVNLHGRVMTVGGLLLAGVEGSPWYNGGPHQYTEGEVARRLYRLVPALLLNHLRTGRYLDILVTHAPPRGIHDRLDVPHRGFTSFCWFLRTFRPRYMLHGHIHRASTTPAVTRYLDTTVVNVYGHQMLEWTRDDGRRTTDDGRRLIAEG